MIYLGISAGFHDAAVSVVSDEKILYASQSERYSGIKNDPRIGKEILKDALSFVNGQYELHYYENPYLKFIRQIYSGETVSLSNLSPKSFIDKDALELIQNKTFKTHSHHLSHAAAGFQTSAFENAVVLVVDAIGEFDTISIWQAVYINNKAKYTKLFSKKYPNSLGLFYSAITQRIGLIPNEEEYITMGMSAYGNASCYDVLKTEFDSELNCNQNLHIGFNSCILSGYSREDIACSAQKVLEYNLEILLQKAKSLSKSENIVYVGGVALNCLANRNIGKFYKNIWIFPNPGDAGSSLGAALLGSGNKVPLETIFLGTNIEGKYPVNQLISKLLDCKIVGVASGRAEFGPRALGNRSLLADPRGKEIKDLVNTIKKRQKFRPFAPVILEEFVDQYFEMPVGWERSPYMQTVAICKNPEQFPAIVHVDNTSRVQTVSKGFGGIRQLLEEWYKITGCPMLLNTSLNIRGEPMVNTRDHADKFEYMYNISVVS